MSLLTHAGLTGCIGTGQGHGHRFGASGGRHDFTSHQSDNAGTLGLGKYGFHFLRKTVKVIVFVLPYGALSLSPASMRAVY